MSKPRELGLKNKTLFCCGCARMRMLGSIRSLSSSRAEMLKCAIVVFGDYLISLRTAGAKAKTVDSAN